MQPNVLDVFHFSIYLVCFCQAIELVENNAIIHFFTRSLNSVQLVQYNFFCAEQTVYRAVLLLTIDISLRSTD